MLFNRRKQKRYNIDCEIKVRMMGQLVDGAECMNISLGGMCIRIPELPEEGPIGHVWVSQTRNGDTVKFEADFKRIWSRPADIGSDETLIGIIFGELSPYQRDNLWHLIQNEID